MIKIRLPRWHWFFYFLVITVFSSFLYLFLFFGLAKMLPQRQVSNSRIAGILIRSQVWEGEIAITGDVWTTPGTTITVKPGTVIKIGARGDSFNMDYLPWHLKSGINTGLASHGVNPSEPFWDEKEKIQLHFSKLFAVGTKEQPIIIKSDTSYPSRYDINVISINEGIVDFAQLSHYRRLEIGKNVTIRDSVLREIGECAVCTQGGAPSLVNNTFEQALRESVWVNGGSPIIAENSFLNLSGSGIIVDPKRLGVPIITHNIFEMPGKDALTLLTGDEVKLGEVSYNTFSGNSTIKLSCDSKVKVYNNSILSVISFIGSGCGGHYTFGPNFWGTADSRTIMGERITNKDQEFSVTIPTVLTMPPLGVGKTGN